MNGVREMDVHLPFSFVALGESRAARAQKEDNKKGRNTLGDEGDLTG